MVVRFRPLQQQPKKNPRSYLQWITYTQINRGTMYKQQPKWFDLLYSSFCCCFLFLFCVCARKWRSTAPSRLQRTYCGPPRSFPRSCICRCTSSRTTRRRRSPPELSIRNLWLKAFIRWGSMKNSWHCSAAGSRPKPCFRRAIQMARPREWWTNKLECVSQGHEVMKKLTRRSATAKSPVIDMLNI